MKRLCPECGEITEWEEINQVEEFNIREEHIEVQTIIFRCPQCRTEYEDLNSEIDPYKQAYEEYRRRKGMVFPSQIISFRKKYKLTQRELSNLLGFGDITVSRYENGSLQDEAHDQLLKFVLDPANLLKLIKQKPNILSTTKKKRIISQLESERAKAFIRNEIFVNNAPSIFTGNKEFDFDKLLNLIKFFTYKNPVYKSKLMKLLFYADFKSFQKTNYSITGLKYAHLPYGPVPDKYSLLLDFILEVDNTIKTTLQPADNPIGEVITSTEPNKIDIFNIEEDLVIKQVHNKFYKFNAKEIEDFSHKEKGYKETRNGEIITYSYASEMQI